MKKPSLPSFDLSGRHSPIPLILLSAFLLIYFANIALAQCDAANRVQWQPKLEDGYDTDRRLEQRVRIEIMGRSANSALKILSEKTGVSLTVAPEDIYSTGERKLSIFAHGITLKSIMVRLPEALQECHWDIDTSGKKTSYLLHRNSDADTVGDWLTKRSAAARIEERRAPRRARLEEARKGLAMSPAELDELEKTDLFLARSLRDPHARKMLQALFSLPPEQFAQFSDTKNVEIPYANASEQIKQAAETVGQRFSAGKTKGWLLDVKDRAAVGIAKGNIDEPRVEPRRPLSGGVKKLSALLPSATIEFFDEGLEYGSGVSFIVKFKTKDMSGRMSDMALLPKYPGTHEEATPFQQLLLETGTKDKDEALKLVHTWESKGSQLRADEAERRRRALWQKLYDPALLKNITLGDKKLADFAELQQFISRQTGLSVISDYFTSDLRILDEVRKPMPIWELLYQVCRSDSPLPVYWKKAGDILIFHNSRWYYLASGEIPEYLINEMRARLQKQGRFTLEDITEFTLALEGINFSGIHIPKDLSDAGIYSIHFGAWALKLYATLTPDQIKKASSSAGLTYEDMTIAQHRQVLERLLQYNKTRDDTARIPTDQVSKVVFYIITSTEGSGNTRFDVYEMGLGYGKMWDVTNFGLPHNNANAPPAKAK